MEFLWVGNHAGVDLCNTVPVVGGQPVELLADPADLHAWMSAALPGADGAGQHPNRATLVWVRRLREALRAVLAAPGDRNAALGALNRILRELSCAPSVDAHGELYLRSEHPQTQLRLDLARLAIDASSLPSGRVRGCANPRCVLLFYDTTKSATRRWHDMATCGNQSKAVAHHARTREQRAAHRR